MIDIERTLKKTNKITDDLVHRVYDYIGDDITILEVDYLNKKFCIERRFKNNMDMENNLKNTVDEFNSEEKIKKYFGLK